MREPINPQILYPLFNEVQISTVQPAVGDEDKPRIVLTYLNNDAVGPAVKALLAVARVVASVGEGDTVDEALVNRDRVFDAEFNSAAMRKNIDSYVAAAANAPLGVIYTDPMPLDFSEPYPAGCFAKGLGANAGMFNVPDNSSGSDLPDYGLSAVDWAIDLCAQFAITTEPTKVVAYCQAIIQAGYNAARGLDPGKVYVGEGS